MSRLFIQRRRFLTGSLAAVVAAPAGIVRGAPLSFTADPFSLGVASGCPRPDRVVLWTRLAPEPLAGGGMPDAPVEVEWQIAEDERFARVALAGKAIAEPAFAHSVHIEARGLRPARWYWYRFRVGGATSPVGRTRTAPNAGASPPRFRFAFASCQQYEQGYYTAYRHMAASGLDLVVHLGDYIYESSWGSGHVRKHEGMLPTTLPEFRDRYALYKSDADLQAAHAAFPWLTIWDDHEVADDYANDRSYRTRHPTHFLAIRAAAYQAYYEHMPLPPSARPRGPNATIYDRFTFGDLAEIFLLDDRQNRSPPACVGPRRPTTVPDCEERRLETRTMLGAAQEAWLDRGLQAARTRWTILAQQTLMAELERYSEKGSLFWMDGWDGYPTARRRILDSIATHRPANPIVIGGDRHAFYVADLKRRFNDAKEPALATEFVGTSITSEGPSADSIRAALARNPHLRYGRGDKRGYVTMELTRGACMVGFEAVANEKDPHSAVSRLATFAVENGVVGAKPA